MAESSNADTMVSGLKVILHRFSAIRANIRVEQKNTWLNHLDLTSWADAYEPGLIPLKEQDGPAPMQADGSPFVFLPPAPVVLFVRVRHLEESYNGRPTDFTEIGPKAKHPWGRLPPSLDPARTAVKVAVRKTRRAELLPKRINETSSGVVEEVPMPSTAPGPSNSPRVTDQSSDQHTAKPIVTTSASLPFLGEGCDPSSLLTFDPDSIEPAAPKIGEEPNLGAVDGPLQRLKVLLSSPVDTLVEDPETIRGILVDIQPRLPVVLVAKLGRQ
ncbi:hypothetical protein QYE76_014460 [Lolium multiflorum]|uniref:Uncharacterized protein n=1 Tax=Lolium multiflorum TaxID=4521 RepID=A0AAD8U4K9_LOLMU|nr:hypothetical protein QYE76_014460 [Lolium multiflorum]